MRHFPIVPTFIHVCIPRAMILGTRHTSNKPINFRYLVFKNIMLRYLTYVAAHLHLTPQYLHVKQLCASSKQINIRQCIKILRIVFNV
jgi:hypothetical protein